MATLRAKQQHCLKNVAWCVENNCLNLERRRCVFDNWKEQAVRLNTASTNIHTNTG
jgi:hypothetical protein